MHKHVYDMYIYIHIHIGVSANGGTPKTPQNGHF